MRGALLAMMCALLGCAEIRVHRTFEIQPTSEPRQETQKFIAFGLKTLAEPVVLSDRCAKGWEDLVARKTAFQSLLTVVTLNLYSPWTVEISCEKRAP